MTRNTEHGTRNGDDEAPILRLRSATFDGRSVKLADTHGTENTEHPHGTDGTRNTTAERNPKPSLRNAFRAFRQSRSRSAEQAAADRRNA